MDPYASLPGWHLIGRFPDHEPGDVGSWLLHHNGDSVLLEVPPGLKLKHIRSGLASCGHPRLKYVTASHVHFDHLDRDVWRTLRQAFPVSIFKNPSRLARGDHCFNVAGEPLWLVHAPKHSSSDTVTIFRGIAMTGDIELGTLYSCNSEVSRKQKAASMDHLRGFQDRTGYQVHTVFSAHMNDFRPNADWRALFSCEGELAGGVRA